MATLALGAGGTYDEPVAGPDPEPPGLLRRWESLAPAVQGALSFPLFAVALFLLNAGVFDQPLPRSVLYGLIEALPLTALLLVATANERRKR